VRSHRLLVVAVSPVDEVALREEVTRRDRRAGAEKLIVEHYSR
jgi:hypothetical protein